MSDILCVVCGEPWEAWGVNHGSMLAWEADLFRKGAGCPACRGIKPQTPFEPRSLEDLENGDRDPIERINAYEDALNGKAPKWEPPKPEVLYTCDGCGVQLVRDLAEEAYDGTKREKVYDWAIPLEAKARRWYVSHNFRDEDPEEAATHWNWHPWEGVTACPICVQRCADCDKYVESGVSLADDPYAPGWSHPKPGCHLTRDAVCIDCYSNYCTECYEHQDACTCERDRAND